MRTLITGARGQIGSALVAPLERLGEVVATDRGEVDITDEGAVAACLDEVRPHVIVNCAAWTAVDDAEHDPDGAALLNATAPAILGRHARHRGIAVVHYSTDYVFDGTGQRPYRPDDTPNPQTVYGRTKLDGEQALIDSGASHLVVRTSWIYSGTGRNFVRSMLQRMSAGETLRIVSDQRGCPNWATDIAEGTAKMIERAARPDGNECTFGNSAGVYHLSAPGDVTWYDFAVRIAAMAGFEDTCRIEPIATADYPCAATRPAYSVLDCARTRDVFGVELAPWEQALEACLASWPAAEPV